MIVCATCGSAVVKRGDHFFHSPGGPLGTIARQVKDTSDEPGPVGVRADRSRGPKQPSSNLPGAIRGPRQRARIGTIKTAGTKL
jgi:hypothetical protein